jgi:rhodanese-related sulfurtransferase
VKFIIENAFLIVMAFVSGTLLAWPALLRRSSGMQVSHLQATQWINNKNALLLDIRSSDEFARGHMVGAKNIPADQLPNRLSELSPKKTASVILVDTKGLKTSAAAALLKKEGFSEVATLEGGVEGWKNAGLPLKS